MNRERFTGRNAINTMLKYFCPFWNILSKKNPKGNTVLILDNARIHHAKLIQPFLEQQKERLQLVYLPPYSPKLNIVEGLWGWLKESVIYNVFFSSIFEIRTAVKTFIDEISKDLMNIVDRLCIRL
jgi:transposase